MSVSFFFLFCFFCFFVLFFFFFFFFSFVVVFFFFFFFFLRLIIEMCQVGGRIRQYSYKRINHLKVRLRRFQVVESENVPEKVYDIVKRDLRKRRLRWVEAEGVFLLRDRCPP